MRRALIGVAAGAVLALAAASGVSAYWQAQQTLPGGVATSGDLEVSAMWRDGTPAWTNLYPGGTTADATIRVTSNSTGDNLRWRVKVTSTVAPAFTSHTSFQAWAGACGGTPIPVGGYGSFGPTDSVDVCIRYTLAAGAPATLQGQSINPAITVHAEQVGG